MISLLRGRASRDTTGSVVGRARIEVNPAALVRRLRPGDIAVLDAVDLDVTTAEALAARRPAAVLNASASVSGRYPVRGASVLVDAGVALVDGLGSEILTAGHDGRRLEVVDGEVHARGRLLARGTRQSAVTVGAAVAAARAAVAAQLEALTSSLPLVLDAEQALVLDGAGLPSLDVPFQGRQTVVVSRGYRYVEDLAGLERFVGDRRPVLVGVDGGADAIVLAGWRPDVVVGDLDVVSDEALTAARAVVAHRTGASSGGDPERLAGLGLAPTVVATGLTSEDTAILLSRANGAARIVVAGSHVTFEDLLDRGRAGAASACLTRLRVGGCVVDAATVADLHRTRPRRGRAAAFVLAGALLLGSVLAVTPTGSRIADSLLEQAVAGIPLLSGAADGPKEDYRLTNGVFDRELTTVRVLVQVTV